MMMLRKRTADALLVLLLSRASPAWLRILSVVCAATVSLPGASAAQPPPPPVSVDVGTLPTGKTIRIEFDTAVRYPFPALVNEVSNQGIITGASMEVVLTDDPGTAPPEDPTVTAITAALDLVISKDDGGTVFLRGDTVLYTLSYVNIGDRNAADVTIRETVPANTEFSPASSTAGWVCASGPPGTATCSIALGEVPAGSAGSVVYAVVINGLTANSTRVIANTAEIAAGQGQTDPDPANNAATDLTLITGKSPDIDGNMAVTEADLIILMRDYHTVSDRCDLSGDGWIDWVDLWLFGRHWGTGGGG